MARAISGSQYLESTSVPVTEPPFSIACWFYVTDTTSAHRLVDLSSATGVNYFSLHARGDQPGDPIQAITDSFVVPAGTAATSSAYSANTWQHAAAVFAASNSRAAYLNGGAKGTDATDRSPAGVNRFCVNRLYYAGTGYGGMSGRICHLAVWSVALADDDVASLAAGFCPLLVRPASLVAYWPFGGFHGDYDRDLVGGYNLTPYNSPTFADQPRIIYPQGPHGAQLAASSPPAATPWLYARRSARIIGGGLS